jgi:hypothetical protein
MIDPTPRAEDLEAGLAEIDRRLRQIQDELIDAEPPASPPPSPDPPSAPERPRRHGRSGPLAAVLQRAARTAAPEPAAAEQPEAPPSAVQRAQDARVQLEDLERQLHALADLRDKLLASIRELVDGYQAAAHVQPGTSPRPGEGVKDAEAGELTVSAGPFASLDAVRAFERAVSDLPGVRETSVRGYEGSDRAIVDVRLDADRASPPSAPKS